LRMSCFEWVVMSCIIYMANCNFTTHAAHSLTFMVYKYSELQMSSTTQKLSRKANYKIPFFLIMLWITFSTCYQTLIQLMLDANSWKVVKRMTKQYYHFCKEFRVEIFSMSNFYYYYKIQHGGKSLVLMNKIIIIFIMKIMHK
jgi:hypothetical protein